MKNKKANEDDEFSDFSASSENEVSQNGGQ